MTKENRTFLFLQAAVIMPLAAWAEAAPLADRLELGEERPLYLGREDWSLPLSPAVEDDLFNQRPAVSYGQELGACAGRGPGAKRLLLPPGQR